MSAEQIPLARPEVGDRELELVTEVMRSGRLSLGPMLGRFERDFAAWAGTGDAVAVSSGTAGLHLAVRALGWGEGDRVLTTPFSFVASSNCLLYEGAEPVFCDVDPVTLNMDPDNAAAEAEGTSGILAVHIFGYPSDLPALERIAAGAGGPVLEDACQAIGAVDSEGKRIGSRGNAASFAFYANKVMTTGEGGILIPSSPEMAEAVRSERNQGRSPDMEVVDHPRIGFNYRLTDIAAAIGVAQLERLDDMLEARREAAALYERALSAIGAIPAGEGDDAGLLLPCRDRGSERRSWFVYPIRLPRGANRDGVLAELGAAGVQAKAYLPCIHLMPPYRERFGFGPGMCPVAEDVAERSVALPFFVGISEEQIERVARALASALA